MKPINFKGANVIFAKDQPEYLPLPAFAMPGPECEVINVWKPTEEERKQIAEGANIGLSLYTFGGALQPQRVFVSNHEEVEDKDGCVRG
jgi:hypothetical protein